MDLSTDRPLRRADIVWRREERKEKRVLEALAAGEDVDDQGTVLLVVDGTMHQLNLVGGMIWSLCDGQLTGSEIADRLAAEFAVERPEVEEDVRAFLEDLSQRGWLINEQ